MNPYHDMDVVRHDDIAINSSPLTIGGVNVLYMLSYNLPDIR